MHHTHTRLTLCLLLAAAYPCAWAQTQDPLTLSASYSVQTDSNLFRLPSGTNTQARIGRADASEQIGVSTLGIAFKTQQSLQQFEFSATVVDSQYQNFNYLSYTASNFDAAWRWAVTPRWHGSFTASRKETLNSFADFQGFNQRNLRLDTATGIDSEYEIDGPWRVVAALSGNRQANQAAQVAGSDFNNTSADVGVRYAFASGSDITYRMRTNQGQYLDRAIPSAGLFDKEYKQLDHDLRLHWAVSGSSIVDANITYVTRSHPTYAQRDYDGFNTGINLNWLATGKTSVSAGYQHTLGAYETANSNYSQTDTITLGPVWQISPKAALRLQCRYDQVQYLGSPTAGAALERRDINRNNTLSLSWQPYEKLSFSTSIGTVSRGSSQPGVDFDATQISFSAQLSY